MDFGVAQCLLLELGFMEVCVGGRVVGGGVGMR